MAPLLILFFGFCLVILPTDTEHTHFSIGPWWAGAGIGFLLTALIAVRSIRITHGGLTTQEIKNAARTMRFLQTGQWGLYAGTGIAVATLLRVIGVSANGGTVQSVTFGAFCAFGVAMGILILLDNFWLRSVFIWNVGLKRRKS